MKKEMIITWINFNGLCELEDVYKLLARISVLFKELIVEISPKRNLQ